MLHISIWWLHIFEHCSFTRSCPFLWGLSSLSVIKCSDFGISDAVAAIIWDEAFESTAKKNKLRRCIRAESKIVNILPKAQNNFFPSMDYCVKTFSSTWPLLYLTSETSEAESTSSHIRAQLAFAPVRTHQMEKWTRLWWWCSLGNIHAVTLFVYFQCCIVHYRSKQ